MPELPEVETTRCGLEPHLLNQHFTQIEVRHSGLRWPVPASLQDLAHSPILSLQRRSKYLLLKAQSGTALIHLGMSGSLRLADPAEASRKHDHLLLTLSSGPQLRYHDPRRFGSWHWLPAPQNPAEHPLLQHLGPEPLDPAFTAETLAARCRHSQRPIKLLLMDPKIVVGIGNIYACEALFLARLAPRRTAASLRRPHWQRLVTSLRQVLEAAITQGGTTLRDFLHSDGQPGYFAQSLLVYGREGQPCRVCQRPIHRETLGQRSTWWCPLCQK